jgi:hypothetical protein
MPTASVRLRTRLVSPTTVLAVALSASLVAAQAPGRPTPPREVRGVVQSVDAKARTITAMAGDGRSAPTEKKYTLAKDAEIAVSTGTQPRVLYTEGKLDDLAAGSAVTLTLADGSDDSVTSVAANGPTLRGRLKSVDAAKKTITAVVATNFGRDAQPEEKTLTLSADAEIGVDDGRGRRFSIREGKLADLAEGSGLTLQLSTDGKTALSVIAEGPQLNGTVLENAADKKQLILRVGPTAPGEEPGERTVDVADDAVVLLDDGRGRRLSLAAGKLADIPAGSSVQVRLSGDQKEAVYVAASGPQTGGLVKEVDAEKRTIKVAMFAARGQEPEEKTLDVAADARIVVDNQPAKLGDVKPADNGPFVNLRLSLDQKTVQVITVNQNR